MQRIARNTFYVLRFTFYVLLITLLPACTVARITRPVLKIGLVGPFEGQYRYVGYDAIYAARLALRQANAAGGVGGYSVELVAYDDRGTVEGARAAARNLAQDPDVVAVIGHFRDETSAAAREIYQQASLPLTVAGTVEGGTVSQADLLCPLLAHLERSFSSRRVQWATKNASLACEAGPELIISAELPPPPGVDAVLLTQDPVQAAETLLALRQAGWGGLVAGGPTLGSPLFTQIAGEQALGVLFASPHLWPALEGTDAAFSSAYQSLGPHVPPPGPFALSTYQATLAILHDIETHGAFNACYLTTTLYLYHWSSLDAPDRYASQPIR
jgi:ABC-type branched-subunit amino acid transport system substrate-binding protein